MGAQALVADGFGPCGVHGAGAGAGLAAHDDPVHPLQRQAGERAEERLAGEELDGGAGAGQVADAGVVILRLHADAHPDVRRPREPGAQKPKVLRPLRENLEAVPWRRPHPLENSQDKLEGDFLMEKVAHGIYENHLGPLPLQGKA